MTVARRAEPELVPEVVVGGADTHADTVHVALITVLGQDLADRQFPTTPAGYRAAVEFLYSGGPITRVGIEGTSSYGAGLCRAARAGGLQVLEVNHTTRAERRRQGKSDTLDAYRAAHAVLSGRTTSAAKTEDIEGVRALRTARRSAVKARTAAANQIHQLLITAPDPVRDKFRGLSGKRLVKALAQCRPAPYNPVTYAVLIGLKTIAQRHQYLDGQVSYLTHAITAVVGAINPGLLAVHGVGPDTAAQLLITAGGNPDRLHREASFAALCGTAPVPASSGKITRHRLSRGGDRGANNALHHIAVVRMSSHRPTRAYVTRQRAAGRSTPEILRMLKRAIAREMFKYLTCRVTVPAIDDLRATRQAKNITLTRAAEHLGLWPTALARIENGTKPDDTLATAYRAWLRAA